MNFFFSLPVTFNKTGNISPFPLWTVWAGQGQVVGPSNILQKKLGTSLWYCSKMFVVFNINNLAYFFLCKAMYPGSPHPLVLNRPWVETFLAPGFLSLYVLLAQGFPASWWLFWEWTVGLTNCYCLPCFIQEANLLDAGGQGKLFNVCSWKTSNGKSWGFSDFWNFVYVGGGSFSYAQDLYCVPDLLP